MVKGGGRASRGGGGGKGVGRVNALLRVKGGGVRWRRGDCVWEGGREVEKAGEKGYGT